MRNPHGNKGEILVLVVLGLLLGATAVGCHSAELRWVDQERTREDPLEVYERTGAPSCEELGLGAHELRADAEGRATYDIDDRGRLTVEPTDDRRFSWSSDLAIDGVIVQGSDRARVYDYRDESFGDRGFHGPEGADMGEPDSIRGISFCYDHEVEVTAETSASARWRHRWEIDNQTVPEELIAAPEEVVPISTSVMVRADGWDQVSWTVQGTVHVRNPDPIRTATITGVSIELDGGATEPITCRRRLPADLRPGDALPCFFSAALADGGVRSGLIRATTGPGAVDAGQTPFLVDFDRAEVRVERECVEVTSELLPEARQVCAGETPRRLISPTELGPFHHCGEQQVVHSVALVASEAGDVVASDDRVLDVTVEPCGCTLPATYWEDHADKHHGRYDATWDRLPHGPDTAFFRSGQTYYEVLTASTQGHPYYRLAQPYIVTELNRLNGAALGGAAEAYQDAAELFEVYPPELLGRLDPNSGLSQTFTDLSLILVQYNEGRLGPRQCEAG